jgi:hypothetical protein
MMKRGWPFVGIQAVDPAGSLLAQPVVPALVAGSHRADAGSTEDRRNGLPE